MSTTHLLRILIPGAAIDSTVSDYDHNLVIGTSLRHLGPAALEQLSRIDAAKRFAAATNDPASQLPETTEPRHIKRDRLEAGLRTYLAREGLAPRAPAAPGAPIAENLHTLAALLELSPIEVAILQFVTLVQVDGTLSEFVDSFGRVNVPLAAAIISAAINEPFAAVQAALAPCSRLADCGVVIIARQVQSLSSKVQLRWGLVSLLVTPDLSRQTLLARYFTTAGPSSLVLSDYSHLDREVRLVIELLAGALAARRPGINVLLYGSSGTGKTELTRVIAQALGVEAFMVHGHDDEGSPTTRNERLSSLRLGQALLRTSRSLLVFDEMEDLFAKGRDKDASHEAMVSKEWLTSFLEDNELPTVWITNSVRGVDRAYLRRFTYSIEFTELTAYRRAEVLEKCARDQAVLSSADVTELAQQYQSSPAQLVGCVAAAALAAGEPPRREHVERFLAPADKLVTGSAAPARATFDPRAYRLDDVNCSEDLARMTDRLSSWRPSAGPGISLCLYGPPGTGKSEYVRYLASRMGRQLVYRHGSDIKSKWVGETEQNLAAAFHEAEAQDALLLFDEADSFLLDRERSVRNYEVNEVNEFLQQLERFRGVVACTTNLWDQLDQAALRRFVFKLEFRPLQLHQALGLFRATFSQWLGTDAEPSAHADLRVALRRHPQLTPGDLAAVRRKVVALSLEPTCADLLELLDLELHAKRPDGGVGFQRA